MTFKEAILIFRSGDPKQIKKIVAEIEQDTALKSEVAAYYADILGYTNGKSLADILKIPKSLSTKKVMIKNWSPNANSIEILNHLTVDYLSLWQGDKIPDWIKHTHFGTLKFVNYTEEDIIYPLSVAKELELRGCGLTAVPEVIKELQPKWLGLPENKIETIPEWVFEVVERLEIGENCISKIELSATYPLTLLRLNKNQLSDVNFLTCFPNLDFLVLNNNPVTDFPKLGNSPMKALYLADCQFTVLPDSINELKRLEVLDLDGNPLEKIPALDLPCLKYVDLASTPIGKAHNVKDGFSSEVEVRDFLAKNASSGSGDEALKLFELLESRDSGKIRQALDILREDAAELEKAEKRYGKFIRARDPKATMFDFEAVMLTEEEAETIGRSVSDNNWTISLSYLDDVECRRLVDFLGSAVESVTDLNALKSALIACSTEEELIAVGTQKLNEIKSGIVDFILENKEGWIGKLLFKFTSRNTTLLAFDHTQFDLANCSDRLEAFYVFLQCFAYEDYTLDVFQSDAPVLGEIFWLLPVIPKVIWGDVEPGYPLSPLAFKRSATLNENNQGKRIKSKLSSEASV